MITRQRAKMATSENSESQEFDINNQLGVEGLDDNTVESNGSNNTNEENSRNRARGPGSESREMDIAMLMEFIKNQSEETRKHNEQQNKEMKE